jgi:hypothetical protein
MENKPHYRSFFWPFILVGVGLVWLLSNLQIIPTVNLSVIFRFWPLLLVLLGLDILIGRRYRWAGAVIGLLAIGGVIALLIASPALGIDTGAQTKTETFSAPVGQATLVNYNLETSSAPVEIRALKESTELVLANITHRGTIRFEVTGTTSKNVSISEVSDPNTWFNWDFSTDRLKWVIQLSPNVLSDLIIDGGSGSINADLTGVMLQSLRTHLGSGSSRFTLPAFTSPYTAEFESGSGSVNIQIPENADVSVVIDSGSGSINVSTPAGSGLRVEIMDEGSGSLNLRSGLEKVNAGIGLGVSAWQSPDYAQATHKIQIQILSQGSGSITIN